MSDILRRPEATPVVADRSSRANRLILLALTLLLSGRAMTLAFLGDVGGSGPTDPPPAWLMPLMGDAVIGLTALLVAYFVWKGSGLIAWATIVVWNAVAIWDALAAFLIHITAPWPSFFMVEAFGSSMFFMAAAMHGVCLYLATRPGIRRQFLGGARYPHGQCVHH